MAVKFYILLFVVALIGPSYVHGLAFKIQPHNTAGKCLTVANGATGDGLVYQVLNCDGSNWQKFEQVLSSTTPSVVQLGSLHTYSSCNPQCIDVVAGSGPQRVIQQPCNMTDRSQFWIPTPAPIATEGYMWYKNLENGLCLTAENLFGGDYVDTFACSGGALHQNWKFTGSNTVTLLNQLLALTAPCLSVDLASPYAGAAVKSKACSPIAGYDQSYFPYVRLIQLWQNLGSNKCIDGGGSAQQPFQYTCTPAALNHQWVQIQYYDESAGGNYSKYLFDMLSGLCLTWDPTTAPTNLQMAMCVKGQASQQWDLNWT